MNGGTINIDSVDVDLANKTMGRITANSYSGENKGTINVKAINLVSDAKGLITPVEFADKSFKNTVKTTVKEAYTPIYKYKVEYDTKQKYGQDTDNGYFVFKRSASPTPEPTPPVPDNFNPAVYSSTVVAQAGGNTAMNQAMMFAFEHGDTFMNFSAMDRFAQINQNTYAMTDTTPLLKNRRGEGVRYDKLALSTDYNNNAGYVDFSHENKSVWVKPYSVFESINLKNGPKVDTISYGSLIGFDSNIHRLKKGWYNVGTGYIGYNGAQIDYKGVDASMNGGLLGLTETFYKGNFWTALTATVGAAGVEAHTMYGKDDMAMLMTGIGSKTGYNFEFADGKFIIQPRIFVAYSMVNTFDYTNAAGVKIDSDPMHTIQLNPAIKFIGNTKNGWQPYASVGMTWNLLNETDTMANGVRLPEMHTKPYVEYGVGVQKLWNDKYSAYGQAMVRNGGRTSVALTLGFRSALGEDGKPIEKTQAKPQKSTMTNNIGYIK
jgi:outer membrane autotransporter protein